ncbi:hypothetical protein [Chryseobacterium sp.]|uniref:hypothetical protein n=1 Tax=Chryseobacterium sp. TaxID=1871047 RepID=UPI0028A2163E|nr:hypothetical protein [Chryseobacterium sp.]
MNLTTVKYEKSNEIKELENMVFEFRKKRDGSKAVKKYYFDRKATELEECIIHYTSCFNGCFAEKICSMGRSVEKDGKFIFVPNNNTTGQADLSLTILGKSIKVEVKCKWTRDKYQNKAQKNYQRQIEKAGGIYLLVREFSEFKIWFDNYVINSNNISKKI